jgi:hypothetical protein
VPFGPDGIDFARLEQEFPLRPEDLAKLTPANLKILTQEELDQIYARLSAGAIPEGAFDAEPFLARGEDEARLAEIIGGRVRAYAFTPEENGGAARQIRETLQVRSVDARLATLAGLGPALWRRKVFHREHRVQRNRIEDLALVGALLGEDPDALRQLKGSGDELFIPAKLYCGQSLLDGRRESVIVDYAFSDEVGGYFEPIDRLAGRHGLQIRDEIRMVRPGLYLGRAYIDRAFALNFVLYNKEVAERDGPAFAKGGTVDEDCWSGTQRRVAAKQ